MPAKPSEPSILIRSGRLHQRDGGEWGVELVALLDVRPVPRFLVSSWVTLNDQVTELLTRAEGVAREL